jgi:histidinol-phosphate aminotransferase
VKLASNENPYPPLEMIRQAVIDELEHVNRYPESGCHYLSHELAAHHRVAPEQIFVGNGSNEILDLLVRAFVTQCEDVIYPHPSFIAYPLIVHQAGVGDVKVPLIEYRLDLEAMMLAVTEKTKMIFICNPNNPTGTYVGTADVERFLDGIRKDVIVVFDEAYYEYVTAPDYPDTVAMLAHRPGIVVLRTFSKVHSLSGVRIGYAVADEGLVKILHMVRQPFNVNRLAQAAARAALRNSHLLKNRIDENNGERDRLTGELRALGFNVPESQTNFLLVLPEGIQGCNLVERLMDLGIIVRGQAPWGFGEDSFRVSIGTPTENDRFLEGLRKVLG